MTSHSELPRFLVLAVALGSAASCSSSGRMPPEAIGYAGNSRPPRHEMVREGRVEDPPSDQYALESGPQGASGYSYLDNPNLAGMNGAGATMPPVESAYGAQPQSAPLNAINEASSEPLYSPGDQAVGDATAEVADVNSEGINIDAELGVGAPQGQDGLVMPPPIDGQPLRRRQPPQQQTLSPPPPGSHFTIAEDNPSQPVVDGIGTDAPVVLAPRG